MTRDQLIAKVKKRKERIEMSDELAEIQRQISDCEVAIGELESGADINEVVEDILGWDINDMELKQ
jgi:hypothetical protein